MAVEGCHQQVTPGLPALLPWCLPGLARPQGAATAASTRHPRLDSQNHHVLTERWRSCTTALANGHCVHLINPNRACPERKPQPPPSLRLKVRSRTTVLPISIQGRTVSFQDRGWSSEAECCGGGGASGSGSRQGWGEHPVNS